LDDKFSNKFKEKLCNYEMQILKTIGFNLDLPLPYDYLETIIRKYYEDGLNIFSSFL